MKSEWICLGILPRNWESELFKITGEYVSATLSSQRIKDAEEHSQAVGRERNKSLSDCRSLYEFCHMALDVQRIEFCCCNKEFSM